MYADPTLIRDNCVKISLNDLEDDLIQAGESGIELYAKVGSPLGRLA